MIEHWPFYASAAALAGVAVVHWFVLRRQMAVSGRYSALVDLMRGRAAPPAPEMTEAELIAAMQAATAAAFGADAISATPEPEPAAPEPPRVTSGPKPTTAAHLAFLGGTLLGGFISAVLAGAFALTGGLASTEFAATFGESSIAQLTALGLGGMLVGFGTRMAAGCTSGHGLCGVSRLQPGSIAATAMFFGTGVVVSFLIGALL
jgi:uncharacterized membrane protein YedE/YeeE